jgi:cold shock CspA family protein
MAQVPNSSKKAFRQAEPGERLRGIVTRWQDGETYGFITSEDKTSYFLSDADLPRGHASLPPGTVVTFAPASNPQPGKRHPRARAVRLADGPEPRVTGPGAQH